MFVSLGPADEHAERGGSRHEGYARAGGLAPIDEQKSDGQRANSNRRRKNKRGMKSDRRAHDLRPECVVARPHIGGYSEKRREIYEIKFLNIDFRRASP